MKKACFLAPKGLLVTAQEFHEKAGADYRTKGIFPYCPACSEVVHLYGIHSTNISRFDHRDLAPNKDPLDDCILADRNSRFKGFEPADWDFERGEYLRQEFFKDENLKMAYAFCVQMTRKNISVAKFSETIGRADAKRIWCYADIPLWVIPYILLTLADFTQQATPQKKPYDFHFVFDKQRGASSSSLWENIKTTRLKKVFSNGEIVNTPDNPLALSDQILRDKAGDFSWIHPLTLQALKQRA